VYRNESNAAAPYYVTIGDGGNREGLAAKWSNPQPAWSAFRQASYGHGELQVFNSTHMLWEWHQNPDVRMRVAVCFRAQSVLFCVLPCLLCSLNLWWPIVSGLSRVQRPLQCQ
jgi:hypothetical protein